MTKIRIVTTSWDDGHPCDLRLAEALAERNLPATFYVPLAGEDGKPVLPGEALRSFLKRGFEIGAHTMSHRILPRLQNEELSREVRGSKQTLEEQLGAEVRMFCYPRGRYDGKVIECVQQSGFAGARTTRMLAHTLRFNRFEMPTSLQAYPHPPLDYLKNLGKRRDLDGIGRYVRGYLLCQSWVEVGKKLFDEVLRHGGIWHLYGHSWELEELGLWGALQEMLDYVANRPGVIYASNSRVLELAREQNSTAAEAA
jgi:peptidoglycan-N-acetylglucosamine deacetylase